MGVHYILCVSCGVFGDCVDCICVVYIVCVCAVCWDIMVSLSVYNVCATLCDDGSTCVVLYEHECGCDSGWLCLLWVLCCWVIIVFCDT